MFISESERFYRVVIKAMPFHTRRGAFLADVISNTQERMNELQLKSPRPVLLPEVPAPACSTALWKYEGPWHEATGFLHAAKHVSLRMQMESNGHMYVIFTCLFCIGADIISTYHISLNSWALGIFFCNAVFLFALITITYHY